MLRSSRLRIVSLGALALTLAIHLSASGAPINSVWTGGPAGDWNDPGNWTPSVVPDDFADTYNVSIDSAVVQVQAGREIQAFNLTEGTGPAAVVISPNAGIEIRDDSVIDGNVLLNDTDPGANAARFFVDGARSVTGNGSIVFNTANTNRIGDLALGGLPELTLSATNTITTASGGFGEILLRLINNGVVDANDGEIVIRPNGNGLVNNNRLQAHNNGTLQISNFGTLDNNAGVIDIESGSELQWLTSAVVEGGSLTGGGRAQANNGVARDLTLDDIDVVIETEVGLVNDRNLTLQGGIDFANGGRIRVRDLNAIAGSEAVLTVSGTVNLTGTGSVLIDTNPTDASNRISQPGSGTHQLNIGPDVLVAATAGGAGRLEATTVNNGTIGADGGELTLITGAKTNNGLVRATGGGTLTLQADLQNAAGIVEAGAGSTVLLRQTVAGGVIQGTGDVHTVGNTGTLDGIGLRIDDATVHVAASIANVRLNLIGTIENNGTIAMNAQSTRFADIGLTNPVSLTGTGELRVDSSSMRNRIIDNTVGSTLTNAGNHTLRIPTGNFLTVDVPLINQANLHVDGVLDYNILGPLVNQGTVTGSGEIDLTGFNGVLVNENEVSPGSSPGTLVIDGGYEQPAGGTLVIELASDMAGDFDVLQTTGAAGAVSLDGLLDVRLLAGFVPDPTHVFQILDSSGPITGAFDNAPADLLTVSAGTFDITYGSNSVSITNFQPAPPPGPGGAIPEPATAALLTLAIVAACRDPRSRYRYQC